jgi:hypothetical protein
VRLSVSASSNAASPPSMSVHTAETTQHGA